MKELIKYIILLLRYLKEDFKDSRIRSSIFLGIANLLPDLYICGFIRPILWKAAGVKIDIFGMSFIRKNVWIDFPQRLVVGRRFHVNRGTVITANGGIEIGDQVILSFMNGIHTVDHEGDPTDRLRMAAVKIGSNTTIYSHSVVLPGVTIGENSVIGANSVVLNSFPSNSIIYGAPARKMN